MATSFSSDTQDIQVKQNIDSILRSGKFAGKGWHSNSPLVDELCETPQTEILSHCWNKTSDNFRPNFDVNLPEKLANSTTKIMAIKNTLGRNATNFDNSTL